MRATLRPDMTEKAQAQRLPTAWRRLTTERSAVIILFLLLFAMAMRFSADTDVWWHLRLGQQIAETGEAIYADTYSWTAAGITHYNHSALAQVILYLFWRMAEHAGLSLFTALTAVTGMVFVYRVRYQAASTCGDSSSWRAQPQRPLSGRRDRKCSPFSLQRSCCGCYSISSNARAIEYGGSCR